MDVDKSVLHFKNISEQEEKSYALSLKSNVNEILRPLFLTQVNYLVFLQYFTYNLFVQANRFM